ncbi:unnamed protein product [Acanthosepion pharaonis]|uniref:Uncharacterized protein n=1 Tax=Acanthosepion pharaonis TaxID=158019 RepID=A0A812D786_ACAPH|nr:unnamed protein product [Sepia pharaonis]
MLWHFYLSLFISVFFLPFFATHSFTFIYFLTHSVSDPLMVFIFSSSFNLYFTLVLPHFHSCLFFTFSLELFLLLCISISLFSFEANIKLSLLFFICLFFLYYLFYFPHIAIHSLSVNFCLSFSHISFSFHSLLFFLNLHIFFLCIFFFIF